MFRHILVAVDGSPTALLAVDKAIALAKAFDSAITLVIVVDYHPYGGIGADYAFAQSEYVAAATAGARQALATAAAAVSHAGLRCEERLVEGEGVHEGILEAGAKAGADLIVMGSRGRQGIEKLLLGGVVQRVLSHAAFPVLVVRG